MSERLKSFLFLATLPFIASGLLFGTVLLFTTVFLVIGCAFLRFMPPLTAIIGFAYAIVSAIAGFVFTYIGPDKILPPNQVFSYGEHFWYHIRVLLGLSVCLMIVAPIITYLTAVMERNKSKDTEEIQIKSKVYDIFFWVIFSISALIVIVVGLHSASLATQLPRFIVCEVITPWQFFSVGFHCDGSFMK